MKNEKKRCKTSEQQKEKRHVKRFLEEKYERLEGRVKKEPNAYSIKTYNCIDSDEGVSLEG
ncbi:hypothetical protein LQ50_19010 [Halalkalibacter okhensis]|uniref:Uncharacterized protein n=1 Tax=Halalkalibacter okhensis TaxID=333138 RepID=A0A0B0ID84_9BACI|nr:hypothetical protein LQ50_19010 [Halalkalibacter okhensis]